MSKPEKKLTELFNEKSVVFYTPQRYSSKPYVTYTKSQRYLNFNQLMTDKLDIADWSHAVVGYQPEEKLIIVKKCEAEEYAARCFKTPTQYCKDEDGTTLKKIAEHSRFIAVGGLLSNIDVAETVSLDAEKINDNIIVMKVHED